MFQLIGIETINYIQLELLLQTDTTCMEQCYQGTFTKIACHCKQCLRLPIISIQTQCLCVCWNLTEEDRTITSQTVSVLTEENNT